MNIQSLTDKIFKDKNGKVVLGQSPNKPIIIFIIFLVVSNIVPGIGGTICAYLARLALLWWAYLEITQGVNYFRKTLGFVAAVYTIVAIIKI